MNVDDFESARDANAPIDMLEQYFAARGWDFQRAGDEEIVAQFQGSWAQYELRAVWREEDRVLQFLALPDIRVTADKRSAMYETLGLINEQLWLGHFDVWSQGGVLVYRHGLLLGDEGLLSLSQAQGLVETAVDECDRFYPAFQFVLWGDKSPRDALASAMVDAAGEA